MPYRRVLQRHYSRYLADIKLRQFIIRSETDTDRRFTAKADLVREEGEAGACLQT